MFNRKKIHKRTVNELLLIIDAYSEDLKEAKNQIKIYEKIIDSLEEDRKSLLNEIKIG